MGIIRSILKKAINKADLATDREGDRLDAVLDTLSKTGAVIADDAIDFAKKTFHNLKDAAGDISEVTKEATKEIRTRANEDYNDVKEIAERRMHETREIVQEKIDSVKNTTSELKEEIKSDLTADHKDLNKPKDNNI